MQASSSASTRSASIRMLWMATLIVPIFVQLAPDLLFETGPSRVGSPTMLFAIVLVIMALAAVSAGMLINRAKRTNEAELGYLGLFFFSISVLSLAHALKTPGVFVAENSTSLATLVWVVPISLCVAIPALLHRSKAGLSVDANWNQWVSTLQFSIVAFSALLVTFPWLFPTPTAGSRTTTAVVVISVVGCAVYSKRHFDLARIAKRAGPLLVSLGYGLTGASMLVWLDASLYSIAFWVAHFLMMFGAISATIGALSIYKLTDSVRPYIETIIDVDPRCALEVGMEPSVLKFVNDLEARDPFTLEHIVRTAELAMIVGPKLGMDGPELRNLGLSALFHDIGRLLIPETVLRKQDELEDREYEIVKRHASYGAEIAENSPALYSIAPAILAHHENIDGSGYPNGLRGPAIPLIARIVAVCDAYDAMANTRRYRPAADTELALEILQRYAGSQWDRRVVETVARTVRSRPSRHVPERLDVLGRIGCDCLPEIKASY